MSRLIVEFPHLCSSRDACGAARDASCAASPPEFAPRGSSPRRDGKKCGLS